MSYTIPEYVDTQEQAILAVASAVKGEQVTGGDGSVNTALDILADALAGENVQVPMTQQGAILALAQYVAGMVKPEGTITITENGEGIDVAQYATADVSVSGGGVDVGALVPIFVELEEPTVGSGNPGGAEGPLTVAIGDTAIGSGNIPGIGDSYLYGSFAAGMTAQTLSYVADTLSAYACTIGDDGEGNAVYLTVAPYALEATRTSGDSGYSWAFVIPEMSEGVALVLYPHTAD